VAISRDSASKYIILAQHPTTIQVVEYVATPSEKLDGALIQLFPFWSVMASAGTRLRKTFQYPSESESSDVSRDELDEEGKAFSSY
jgi:hypothetical protein